MWWMQRAMRRKAFKLEMVKSTFNLGSLLNEYAPEASFIPEIWQGHKNAGRGFRLALSKLQRLPTWGGDCSS